MSKAGRLAWLTLLLLLPHLALRAQTPDANQNYVRSQTILIDKKADGTPVTENDVDGLSSDQKQESITYLDGLGRPIQTVQWQGSPTRQDIVQPTVYDALGREPRKYLPYTGGNTGSYQPGALTTQSSFYLPANPAAVADGRAATPSPFAETVFEASPLNRVLEQGAPGTSWQIATPGAATNKTIKQLQRTNTAEEVRLFTYAFSTSGYGSVSSNGHYSAGELFVAEVRDEHNFLTLTYTDKQGQVVLKKVQGGSGLTAPASGDFLLTYYIYDDFGQLRMTIQPEGAAVLPATGTFTPDAGFTGKWCFTYHYDARGRVIEKTVPGGGKTVMVYGKRDELLLTQDANQQALNHWSFTKYDAFGRTVFTGIYLPGTSQDRNGVQAEADAFTSSVNFEQETPAANAYTLQQTFPAIDLSRDQLLTINFYDDYTHGSGSAPAYIPPGGNFESTPTTQTRGLPTGRWTRVLGTNDWQGTVTYYDKYQRPIQVRAGNNLGGEDVVSNRYDFAGRLLESKQVHSTTGKQVTVAKTFTYDHAGRKLTEQMQVDSDSPVLLARYRYNELGELTEKKLHSADNGQTFLQTVDLRYHIRGWLEKINDPNALAAEKLFGFELLYDQAYPITNHKAQYNGNISAIKWKSNRETEMPIRAYAFRYDAANRLTNANYRATNETGFYSVSGVSYDKNGNITNLRQNGLVQQEVDQIDNLTYSYEGNRLAGVDDEQTWTNGEGGDFFDKDGSQYSEGNPEYLYDRNGNLTLDKNKGITGITYNYLNLPEEIRINGGTIRHTYDAAGSKLRTEVIQPEGTTTTHYVGGFVYESSPATGNVNTLSFFGHSEGRVRVVANKYRYEYDYKDHLGNVRMTYAWLEAHQESTMLTMEAEREGEESGPEYPKFDRADASYRNNQEHYQGVSSVKLNRAEGPLIRVPVQRGDKVKASAFYKFYSALQLQRQQTMARRQTESPATNLTFPLLGAAPMAVPAQPGAETKKKAPAISLNVLSAIPLVKALKGNKAGSQEESTATALTEALPDAFLQFELLDEEGEIVRFQQLKVGVSDAWSLLNGEEITDIDRGTIRVTLINNTPQDVWFDNFGIVVERAAGVRVLQEDHYYPFGLTMNGLSYRKEKNVENKWQYNSKEKISDLNLGWIDYGARFYDPALGRWHSVDPMTETQESWSPYHYVYNNPVLRTDPDGRCPDGDCPGENGEVGMIIGATVLGIQSSIMTLAYNAGDFLGITPTAPGMKWEAVERQVGDHYETVMEQVPRAGFVRDAVGHVLDGANASAVVSGGGATTGLMAKSVPKATVANEVKKVVIDVKPKDVNFSQTTINKNFDTPTGKENIKTVINKGPEQVKSFPPIQGAIVKGQMVVRNGNSRLLIARETKAPSIKFEIETGLEFLKDLNKRLNNNSLPQTGTPKLPTPR